MQHTKNGLFTNTTARLLFILFLALIVRLFGIASRPIWYDEAFSILFSEKGLGQMLYGTLAPTGAGSADIHPLAYYTILWGWMKLFGQSLIAVRILSVLAGLGVVYLAHQIAKKLFDIKTAGTAALITALAPFQVHYAQEIRMYALLTFWLLLAVYAYLRGYEGAGWQWWLVFGITSALAQYTHNLAGFFLIPLAVTPLLKRDWKTLQSVLISGLFAILLYLPWLIQLPAQFAKVDQAYWVTKPEVSRLFTLLLVFTTNIPLPNAWILLSLAIALVILALAVMQTVRAEDSMNKKNGLWVLYLAFVPPLSLFAFSQWIPVYIERALLPSGVFFCIWLAWVSHNTKMSITGRGLILVLIGLSFTVGIKQHITSRGFPYGPFQELTTRLRETSKPDELILHSNKLSVLPAIYFDRDLPQAFIGDPPGGATDTLASATQEVLNIKAESDVRSATNNINVIWYIIYQNSIDEFIHAGMSTHPDIEYLNSEYTLKSQESWDDLLILYYERP